MADEAQGQPVSPRTKRGFRKPVSIEVMTEGNDRVLVSTFANGEVVRQVIEKTEPLKKPKRPHPTVQVKRRPPDANETPP